MDAYNFYSSGEEVLREDDCRPAARICCAVANATGQCGVASGTPFGTYTWYWQEKGKGTCEQDWFLGSSHGGWQFSPAYESGMGYLAPASANVLPASQLQTNSFFTFASTLSEFGSLDADLALLNPASGSAYAAANRNRILSDAIPAMSLVAGANPVPSFDNDHNLNMNTPQFQNGWPQGRLNSREGNNWHHSDFVNVAYPFTFQLFNQFVTLGNLK